MEEKISVTIKAGTGFDVPWIVLKAASLEEMAVDVRQAQELLQEVSYLAKQFEEVYKSTPANAGEMVKLHLGATQVSMEPTTSEPVGLGDIFKDTAQAAPAMPWDQPQAAPVMPWDQGPSAPTVTGPVLVQLPFAKEGDTNYERIRQFKNHFFQQRNKLNWNAARKGFEFTSTPTPEQLNMARQGAAALGGKVVE